jgi:hypothetical protein
MPLPMPLLQQANLAVVLSMLLPNANGPPA